MCNQNYLLKYAFIQEAIFHVNIPHGRVEESLSYFLHFKFQLKSSVTQAKQYAHHPLLSNFYMVVLALSIAKYQRKILIFVYLIAIQTYMWTTS